jgi:hypothetical protein
LVPRVPDYTVYKAGEEMPGKWFIALIPSQFSSGAEMQAEALRQAREHPERLRLTNYGVQTVDGTVVFGFEVEDPPEGVS